MEDHSPELLPHYHQEPFHLTFHSHHHHLTPPLTEELSPTHMSQPNQVDSRLLLTLPNQPNLDMLHTLTQQLPTEEELPTLNNQALLEPRTDQLLISVRPLQTDQLNRSLNQLAETQSDQLLHTSMKSLETEELPNSPKLHSPPLTEELESTLQEPPNLEEPSHTLFYQAAAHHTFPPQSHTQLPTEVKYHTHMSQLHQDSRLPHTLLNKPHQEKSSQVLSQLKTDIQPTLKMLEQALITELYTLKSQKLNQTDKPKEFKNQLQPQDQVDTLPMKPSKHQTVDIHTKLLMFPLDPAEAQSPMSLEQPPVVDHSQLLKPHQAHHTLHNHQPAHSLQTERHIPTHMFQPQLEDGRPLPTLLRPTQRDNKSPM